MMQSVDCCFYGNEFGVDRCRNTDRPPRRYACPKSTEGRRREKKESSNITLKEKKRQGHLTMKWLKQNYCACPDVCLPREIVYDQYLEFCRKERISPACKATFGKLIRNTFPEVSSKRLGARGHSKYHYNGIGIKQSSEFRSAIPTFEGVTRFSSVSSNSEKPNLKKFCLSSKVGTLLPNFPEAEDLEIPVPADKAKMATFILMYKTHCQCILHVVISGNFEELRIFLLHFWQGFPDHLMSLVRLQIFQDLVRICDCILYRTLLDVLVPTLTFEMPERLLQNIQNTGIHWNLWMQSSLENMPQELIEAKMAPAKRFCRSLKRGVSFIHLTQVTRPILASDAPTFLNQELEVFLEEVTKFNWSQNEGYGEKDECDITTKQTKELQNILNNCGSIDVLIDTMDKMLLCLKGWKKEDRSEARNFVFNWVYTLSKISYVLTENQSRYFTTFHLLSSLIQEYILLAVEYQLDKEHEESVHAKFKKHLRSSGRTPVASSFPESCSQKNRRNQPDTKHLSTKQKPRKLRKNVDCVESPTPNTSYRNGAEMYPGTCIYYSRSETPVQERPSCKYTSSTTYQNSRAYDYQSNPVVIGEHTEQRSINGLSQLYPNTFFPPTKASTRCDKVFSSPDSLNIPQFELYFFDRSSCDVNANANNESTWNKQ